MYKKDDKSPTDLELVALNNLATLSSKPIVVELDEVTPHLQELYPNLSLKPKSGKR